MAPMDLGKVIVLNYVGKRLISTGSSNLATTIEHTVAIRGNGFGSDIASFGEDGPAVYIE